jgi:hypothetical protein
VSRPCGRGADAGGDQTFATCKASRPCGRGADGQAWGNFPQPCVTPMWAGSRGKSSCIVPLDPWSRRVHPSEPYPRRPNTHAIVTGKRRGRHICGVTLDSRHGETTWQATPEARPGPTADVPHRRRAGRFGPNAFRPPGSGGEGTEPPTCWTVRHDSPGGPRGVERPPSVTRRTDVRPYARGRDELAATV